jgi:hypothetical protein
LDLAAAEEMRAEHHPRARIRGPERDRLIKVLARPRVPQAGGCGSEDEKRLGIVRVVNQNTPAKLGRIGKASLIVELFRRRQQIGRVVRPSARAAGRSPGTPFVEHRAPAVFPVHIDDLFRRIDTPRMSMRDFGTASAVRDGS